VRFLTAAFFLIVLVLASACGGDAGDSAGGSADNATTGQNYEHLEGRLPDEFPKDFPVYADVTIHRGDTIDDRYAIDMRSTAPVDEVVSFYRQGLSVGGWAVLSEEPKEGHTLFKFEATDGRPFHGEVAIGKLQELTWILVALRFE
jgi:hypothetical protein